MSIAIKPTANYMSLDSWILANVLQLATFEFCRKFLNRTNDPAGRMFDQMTQAARSIQANIAEGCSRHQTSAETELRLLDVARASASELAGDYMFILMSRWETAWEPQTDNWRAVHNLNLERADYKGNFVNDAMNHILRQRQRFQPWTENQDISIAANSLLIVCERIISMVTGFMSRRLEEFKEKGGFAENLTKVRIDKKKELAESSSAPLCPKCGGPMHEQTVRRGVRAGEKFWSCLNYPKCNGTRNV